MNTTHLLSQYALQELKDSYPQNEIQSICRIIYMDVLHFTNIDIHLRKNEILDESFINIFLEIIQLLKAGKPIQYIIGETEFCGLRFGLCPATLIPRPETAELIEWAKEYIHSGQQVTDIGTGSGCIAIALSHFCPEASVWGVDISEQAAATARLNAQRNNCNTQFVVRDILRFEEYNWPKYDLIISNPPYIRESEKADMSKQVTDHEPALALFVPNEDPLLFYKRIADFGRQYLQAGGVLFFEINEAFGTEVCNLLKEQDYQHIELRKDFFGKDRMVKALRPPSPLIH